jgi:hypothetical protein
VRSLLDGVGASNRIIRTDAHGEQHVFVTIDCGDVDLLVGVSSRREMNVPGQLTGNLATNVLLEVLTYPDPHDRTRPLYGEIGAEDLSRLWRNDVGVAHVQTHARNWDLILWSRSDFLDYLVPGTAFMGAIRGNQAAEQATALVVNSSKHKATAHREGKLKYARGQTHPLINVHPVTREILGYNEPVVAALREAVQLLRSGASWDEAAAAVGGRIPAPQAQQEPDFDPEGARPRTRAARNERRRAQGRPELPLKFLPDGSPNPDYQPETILDLDRPSERLQELLLKGPTVPVRDAESIRLRIDDDLEGIAPEDAFHELYLTGVYRRLVKDQEVSNHVVTRYRWEALHLGPTADGEPVLTRTDVEFLRSFRSGKAGTGSWGNNPLTGVFHVEQSTPLYTRSGWLDPTSGMFRARSGVNGGERGIRIWFEPHGSTPHSGGCRAVGWVTNTDLGPAIAAMLIDAVTGDFELAQFRFDHPALRENPVATATRALREAEARHETTALRLADPDLPSLTVETLKRHIGTLAAQVDDARAALALAEQQQHDQQTHNDTFDISDLAGLAALLQAAVPVPPNVAERSSRLLRTLLHNPTLTLEPATASIRITATLMLSSSAGQLAIPVSTTVRNRSSDPWTAGVAGMWWERRTVPFAELMTEHGLATTPSSASRWHQPVAERLLEHARLNGRALRGPNLAKLVVRCGDPAVLQALRNAIDGQEAGRAMSDFLFSGPDIAANAAWSKAVEMLGRAEPEHECD